MPTLHWIGKQAVLDYHEQVPCRPLQRHPRLSVVPASGAGAGGDGGGWENTTDNLIVQGDNLAALQALLPEFAGRVRCIYIDPPYNTGNEKWVYNDAVNSPEMRAWLGRAVGAEAEDLSRHDKWLCMMYPRLRLLRRFLSEDGVIFVSIDDTELANLVAIMDEIFGAGRRLGIFSWVRKKKGSNLSGAFRKITEYVVAYKRELKPVSLFGVPAYQHKQVPLLNRANPVSRLQFPAGVVRVGRGVADGVIHAQRFKQGELAVDLENDMAVRGGVVATAFALTGRWRWAQATVDDELANGSIFTVSKDFRVNVSRYNQAEKSKALASLLSPADGIGTNEDATDELRAIFPERSKLPFDFPKPLSLVQHLVRSVCHGDPDAIVLDSFAGSGTTGHAVLALNGADGGRRRFILVEMDADIARHVAAERLRRVCSGVGLGGGFWYCTLGEVRS